MFERLQQAMVTECVSIPQAATSGLIQLAIGLLLAVLLADWLMGVK